MTNHYNTFRAKKRGVLEKLVITGGTPLIGEVTISGAKNSAVAILPATLLINGICTIENLPNISDVKLYCDILKFINFSRG